MLIQICSPSFDHFLWWDEKVAEVRFDYLVATSSSTPEYIIIERVVGEKLDHTNITLTVCTFMNEEGNSPKQ